MEYEKYRDILMNGERIDWYGEMVPFDLITYKVRLMADSILEGISKVESDISELRGGDIKKRKQDYVDKLKQNIRNLPYTENFDVYMMKRREIEAEMEKLKKQKPKKTRSKKETTPKVEKKTEDEPKVTSNRKTKNSNLIFGK